MRHPPAGDDALLRFVLGMLYALGRGSLDQTGACVHRSMFQDEAQSYGIPLQDIRIIQK